MIGSIISLEEIIYGLEIIPKLNEKKITEYLEDYNIQALYQKTGYLLTLFNDTLKLSEFFFEGIKKRIHKGVVYISDEAKQDGIFIKAYQVVVPKWLEKRVKLNEI
jgi:hypothetical protein